MPGWMKDALPYVVPLVIAGLSSILGLSVARAGDAAALMTLSSAGSKG